MDARLALMVVAGAVLLAAPAAGAQPSFQGLGTAGGATSNASAISDDGAAAVGTIEEVGGDDVAFRWTVQGGMQRLPHLPGGLQSFAQGTSADGQVVVGVDFGAAWEGARWDGDAVSALPPRKGASTSYGQDVSADGSIVVGFTGERAFRWGGAGGQALFTTPSFARAVSADGATIVGEVAAGGPFLPYRWTVDGVTSIPVLPGAGSHTAQGVSDDGTVVVGGSASQAYRWTDGGGTAGLGFLPGATTSAALDVSADGAVVVGTSGGRAFIWTEDDGMISIQDSLGALGVDLTGWTLRSANGVSADGAVVAGFGTHNGATEAFRAVIPRCPRPVSWLQPIGGTFGDPTRWDGGSVPTSDETARFAVGSGTEAYTILFGGPRTTAALEVSRGAVTLDLTGATYSLAGGANVASCEPPLRIVNDPDAAALLSVEHGQLTVAGDVDVRGDQNGLTVFDAQLLATGALTVTAEADSASAPRVRVSNLALLTADGALVGVGNGEAGVLDVRGGGQVDVDGALAVGVGVGSAGWVRVMGEGELRADEVTVGFLAGSAGDVRVEGDFGAGRLIAVDRLDVGWQGTGTLRVVGGGLLNGGFDTVVGFHPGSTGLLVINASTATFRYVEVGLRGEGLALLAGGATVEAGRVTVGAFTGGEGEIVIQEVGTFFAAERVALGLGGIGALLVQSGSTATVGELVVGANGTVDTDGGTLVVGSGSLLARGGGLSADTLLVAPSATLTVAGVSLGAGGVLGGTGTLSFDLTNSGAINPGDSAGVAGTFTIGGAYTQAPAGALEIELGGAAAGAYDRLAVIGAAALDGTLRFSHIGGFTPAPGDIFDVLTAGSVTGAFGSVEGPPGCTYSLAYGATTVTATVLTVAAEPPAGAAGLVLHAPAPNPASGRTTLRYELPAAGAVRLAVYDALGREVAVLADGELPAGAHEAALDAGRLAPGAYVLRLAAAGATAVRRLAVVR